VGNYLQSQPPDAAGLSQMPQFGKLPARVVLPASWGRSSSNFCEMHMILNEFPADDSPKSASPPPFLTPPLGDSVFQGQAYQEWGHPFFRLQGTLNPSKAARRLLRRMCVATGSLRSSFSPWTLCSSPQPL